MCDVPRVLDRDAVLGLEAYRTGPGDMRDPVGAFPHGRELVETFPGEDPPEDKVARLESARTYVAAVLASQVLLVLCRSEGGTAAQPVEEQQVVVVEVLLIVLIEGKDPCGSVLDLCREDCFSSIHQGEWRLASGLCRVCADGPEHGWELVDPALAVALEAIEASCLETFEDLSICSLGLTVALWVSHRGEAELGAEALAVAPEDAAGELRAIVGDDAVWHAKMADQASDEFDCCSGWYGAHRFNL